MGIGLAIAEQRIRRGFTDQHVAEALSLNLVKYRTVEEDITEITLELVIQIADFYGISLDELLKRNADPLRDTNVQDLKHVLQQTLRYDGKKLSSQQIRSIEEYVEQLSRQSQKLEELIHLVQDDHEFVKKLQELKIIAPKINEETIISTLEKALT